MGKFIRCEERLEDNIIHHFAVTRLMTQHGKGIVNPIQQQSGLLDPEHPVFQFCVAHRYLRVYSTEECIQVMQRAIQFLSHLLWKTFQRPHNVTVMSKHHLGVVIHVATQLLLRLPGLFAGNALILHNTPPLQQREYLLRLYGHGCSSLLTRVKFLHMFHIQCLLYRLMDRF